MIIYYKDKDIAVCEKIYGVSSQINDKENMVSMLEKELNCTVYPVHRLDTTTTGLIVYALNKKSAARLSDTVARGELNKEYYAVAHGEISTVKGEMLSLVRIKLYTGRTHQIRVQMANMGSPLFGDGKYGAKDNGKIRLHSSYLSFPHPSSGRMLEFSSLPQGEIWDDFKISE